MPPAHADQAQERVWPTVESPRDTPVKATQRDLRRYRSLRAGLARLQRHQPRRPATTTTTTSTETAPPPPSRASTTTTTTSGKGKKTEGSRTDADNNTADVDTELTEDDERALVEPLTWAALAYSGFMWWASAGEQARSDEAEEAAHDASLLAGLSSASPATPYSASTPTMNMNMSMSASVDLGTSVGSLARGGGGNGGGEGGIEGQDGDDDEDEARVELATIAYFHRLTTLILTTLADVVAEGGGDSGSDSDPDNGPSPGYDDDEEGDEGGEDQALLSRVSEEADDDDEVVNARRRGGGRGGGGGGSSSRSSRRSIGIGSQAMAEMGLDVWSASDAAFVVAAVEQYFGRRALVEGKGVEVCGVRVC